MQEIKEQICFPSTLILFSDWRYFYLLTYLLICASRLITKRHSKRAQERTTRSQIVARIADRTAFSTFGGHVTPSVTSLTWPFDSPYAISYWCFWNQTSISNGFRDKLN